MKILLFILLLPSVSIAVFFGDFVPTPQKMLDFYHQSKSTMLPLFDREKRLKSQNIDSIIDGEPMFIYANGKKVFSIFIESEKDTNTGVILLHTRGLHPNEKKLINPLRINMAEKGYHTLSVQMPVLEKNATYYDYVPIFYHSHSRIKAAIDFYKKIKVKNIVFIVHGCGGHMLMSYIDKYGDGDINFVIGIGMGATDTGQEVVKQYPLATMGTPVLDIIGEYDYGSVKKHFKTRLAHLQLGNKNSKQVILPKAKHYHQSGIEFAQLTKEIYKFLDDLN